MSGEVNTDFTSQVVRQNLSVATPVKKLTNNSQSTETNDSAADVVQTNSSQLLQNYTLENMQNEINLLQSTGANLDDIKNSLDSLNNLLSKTSNDTNDTEKENIKSQIEELTNQINEKLTFSSSNTANMNGTGNSDSTTNSGNASNNTITIINNAIKSSITNSSLISMDQNLDQILSSPDDLKIIKSDIANALSSISSQQQVIQSSHNNLINLANTSLDENSTVPPELAIRDSTTAQQTLNTTQNQILQNAPVSLASQANQSPALATTLI